MRFHHKLRYDASPDDVFEMLADPSFRERVCSAQQVKSSGVTITPDGDGMGVVVDQKRPSEGIPGFAKKIVGEEIHIVQEESWSSGSNAVLHVRIPGKPGELKGRITLASDGAGTVETVDGDLNVNIPLVAGKLESLIADMLGAALRVEEKVGREWLAKKR